MAVGSAVAYVADPDDVIAGFAFLGVLWYGPPAFGCLLAIRGARRRTRRGYWTAAVVHGALASIPALVILSWVDEGSFDTLVEPGGIGVMLLLFVNIGAIIALLRADARHWFGLARLR